MCFPTHEFTCITVLTISSTVLINSLLLACGSLAAWEGNAWHSLGLVDGKGSVMALARLGRVLYVAGSFSGINGKPMSNLARHTISNILIVVTLYVTCTDIPPTSVTALLAACGMRLEEVSLAQILKSELLSLFT